ncbi:MAG: PP2C family protein-serine/threonine phosphatase [Oscillospiraceae bacterium]
MKKSIAFYSDEGGRSRNEDTVLISEHDGRQLVIAADGLGGLDNGARASGLAAEIIFSRLSRCEAGEQALLEAVAEANSAVRAEQKHSGDMCTTAAVLWIDGAAAYACHVGDTRIYQFRGGEIVYQSIDHSVSQMAVMMGEITPGELRTHKDRNRLVRALGRDENVRAQTERLSVRAGDSFLLCTDGFWEKILEEEMLECRKDADDAGEWLSAMRKRVMNAQNEQGDNNSAAAVIIGVQNTVV